MLNKGVFCSLVFAKNRAKSWVLLSRLLSLTVVLQADGEFVGFAWQAIVADAEYLTQADDMLRDWLQDQCITWIESPDARMYRSQIAVFANRVLEMYFGVVKWNKVASALCGE